MAAHTWSFYLSPLAAWQAMYKDCAEAEHSIELEQYIFENDEIGQHFLDLFIDKAQAGLRVFLICDKFGSATLRHSPLLDKLREAGGQFYFYHNIYVYDIVRPWLWFPRTHVKSLLIDSRIAYAGGVCIASYMRDWRDTQIRITGPVVAQFQRAFAAAERQATRNRVKGIVTRADIHQEFTYLQSMPLASWYAIYRELVRAIQAARQYIYISTPFYAPNRRFRRLLRRAAQHGVDVRLLMPERSDSLLATWLAFSYAHKMLRSGARIYLYQHMLHNKTVVIDDTWATIGSTNMDVMSFFRNRESNLVMRNVAAVGAIKGQFLDDLQRSRELTIDEVIHWPHWKIVAGTLARMIKSFVWKT